MTTSSPFVIAIPARLGSIRLPRKPLRCLAGEPLIRHVARRALASGAAQVVVASDSQEVLDCLADMDVVACRTRTEHASGSDRLAECAHLCGWDDDQPVVNLQGDEPFAPAAGIRACVDGLLDSGAAMATLATPLQNADELFSPDCVKLVCNRAGNAMYFSRAPVPWARDALADNPAALPTRLPLLRHIGLYAYRAGFLREFSQLPPGTLEQAESLEQLRALEHGYTIAVRQFDQAFPPGIDTEADLQQAETHLQDLHHE